MAKSAVHFHPTVDTFGELTLHARRIGSRFMTVTWTGVNSGIDHAAKSRVLIGLGFLLSFALFLASIVLVDQAVFATTSAAQEQTQMYYGGVLLDYD